MRPIRDSGQQYATATWLIALMFAASLACSEADAERSSTQTSSTAKNTSQLDPSIEQERLDKLRAAPVHQNVRDIDHAAARSHRRVAAQHAPARLLAALENTPIPALVPDDPTLLAVAKATSGPQWYAVSMSTSESNVFITGTRLETVIPSIQVRSTETTQPRRIARVRGIARLDFHRFGAAYTLEVECAAPQTDPRCTGDDYILSLADGLAVAGGVR